MRQYVASLNLDKTQRITVSGKDFKYLVQVLRLKEGDALEVRTPEGKLEPMIIEKIQSKQLILKKVENCFFEIQEKGVLSSSLEDKTSKNVEIWLFQFLPKLPKMDLIIRQSVECGVSVVVPIIGEYSSVNSEFRQDRWQRIVKEAAQQSGTSIMTRVMTPLKISDAMALWKEVNEKVNNNSLAFLLNEKIDDNENSVGKCFFDFINNSNTDSVKDSKVMPACLALCVGCEGGYHQKEIDLLIENNFNNVHFNTNILRSETAALYGIAVVQNTYMEFLRECRKN